MSEQRPEVIDEMDRNPEVVCPPVERVARRARRPAAGGFTLLEVMIVLCVKQQELEELTVI